PARPTFCWSPSRSCPLFGTVPEVLPTMTEPTRPSSSFAKKRLALILAGGLAGVVVGLGGVYGITALTRNAGGDTACRPALEAAQRGAPLAPGEGGAVEGG